MANKVGLSTYQIQQLEKSIEEIQIKLREIQAKLEFGWFPEILNRLGEINKDLWTLKYMLREKRKNRD